MNFCRIADLLLMCVLCAALGGRANAAGPATPPELEGVGIEQHLGSEIPTGLVFRDEEGRAVRLADLLQGKPAVLALVYYKCPMLCTVVLTEMLRSLQAMPLKMHDQYNVITVSFDPSETPELAAAKKKSYASAYGRAGAQEGWHFLTGDADAIHKLTDAVGFQYKFDPASQQFIHPSGLMVLAPDGHISRYFFGIDYDPFDLRMALLDASQGRVGSPTDKILLYCYHYDPATGRYGVAVLRLLKIAGVVTLLLLGSLIAFLFARDRRRTRALMAQGSSAVWREDSP